ncbi:MAG TPA: type II toxin-antitoxin system VapC family toxin [Pirellulales bacterium]|nr:type II toxin-antitoxin system VapC family toxin [Pirellulales bacterium]
MSTIVLDTNIVSYLMKGHALAERYRSHLDGKTLAVSFMAVAELYEGACRADWGPRRLARFDNVLRSYVVIPASPKTCKRWGLVRAERRSQPISCEDAWIAAVALVHQCPLATHNAADFANITGREIITEARG